MSKDDTGSQGTADDDPVTYDTRIRDNDPRMPDRVLQVTGFEGNYVFAKIRSGLPGKLTRIRRDRIYTDGKARKSGWSIWCKDQAHER